MYDNITPLVFRELDAHAADDRPLLDIFLHCRTHVERIAASPLATDHVALTTKNGFVQFVYLTNGEYRLFLTHVGEIPLDSSLRCFSLLPPPHQGGGGGVAQTHVSPPSNPSSQPIPALLYSLSYSNELLHAEMSTGRVRVVRRCHTRPSVTYSDDVYVICGEGDGAVTVWRHCSHGLKEDMPPCTSAALTCPAEVSSTTRANYNIVTSTASATTPSSSRMECVSAPWRLGEPLWHSNALVDDTVVSLGRCEHRLICCSASGDCVVADAESGSPLTRLRPRGADEVRSVLPLPRMPPRSCPATCASVLVCQPHGFSCFSETAVPHSNTHTPPASTSIADTTASAAAAMNMKSSKTAPIDSSRATEEEWCCTSARSLDVSIRCVTCLRDYIAAGTDSGVVVLYRCHMSRAHIRDGGGVRRVTEVMRFHVGFGVVGLQGYSNGSLSGTTAPHVVPDAPLHASGLPGSSSAQPSQIMCKSQTMQAECDTEEEQLLVVTCTGDVWKWSLAELLRSADSDGAEAEEEESDSAEQRPRSAKGLPSPVQPCSTCASTSTPRRIAAGESKSAEMMPVPRVSTHRPASPPRRSNNDDDSRNKGSHRSSSMSSSSMYSPHVADTTQALVPSPKDKNSPATCIPHSECAPMHEETVIVVHVDPDEPDEPVADSRTPNRPSHSHREVVVRSSLHHQLRENVAEEEENEVNNEDDHAPVAHLLGPAPMTLPHLRHGRRMSPRRIDAILRFQADNDDDENNDDAAPVERQTTHWLQAQGDLLRAPLERSDVARYAENHPLEQDALRFRHPVRLERYGLYDRVFANVSPSPPPPPPPSASREAATNDTARTTYMQQRHRRRSECQGHSPHAEDEPVGKENHVSAGRAAATASSLRDDLMDSTFARLTRVHRRPVTTTKAPEIYDDAMMSLLYAMPGVCHPILFDRTVEMPKSCDVLRLPPMCAGGMPDAPYML